MVLAKNQSTGSDSVFMGQIRNVLDLMRRGENLRFEVRFLTFMVEI